MPPYFPQLNLVPAECRSHISVTEFEGQLVLLTRQNFVKKKKRELDKSVTDSLVLVLLCYTDSAIYALKRSQTKKRKVVDRRASKSRKIRYHVHEKIFNFMAPLPMDLPPIAPKLFENFFGLKTPKPASVV
ncbi:Protein AATF [Morella rubra]|uniref:Protein AATF n=1 Tax=Morella rubra TaxID=262757 RepID=A0A6A1WK64_9ROSI|nr:Protein AATF [Morella rubra]